MAVSRLGPAGHGVSPAGSFAGKTASGGGPAPHPVGRITRCGSWGHGTRRTGSFAGKTASGGGGGGGAHPVDRITRLGAWGHGTRRVGAFDGKAGATEAPQERRYGHRTQSLWEFREELAARHEREASARRQKDEDELMTILAVLFDKGLL